MTADLFPVAFISHGGGPLPLLGDPQHAELVASLQTLATDIAKPDAIVVVSAHWEQQRLAITSARQPALIYDYKGFPPESYELTYAASGAPELANVVRSALSDAGVEADLDNIRGFDHGMFVPLKIMYPDADIPCVQLSLNQSLDPQTHIKIGQALSPLRQQKVLVLGSGLSFHNLKAFFSSADNPLDAENRAFEKWLSDLAASTSLDEQQRQKMLVEWEDAPAARYCHPREEHLIPFHVCYGCAAAPTKAVYRFNVMGKQASNYCW